MSLVNAADPEVALTVNMWTDSEPGFVNGVCKRIESILRPADDRNAEVVNFVMVNFREHCERWASVYRMTLGRPES